MQQTLKDLMNTKRYEKDVEGRLKAEAQVVCKTVADIMAVVKKCMNTPDATEISLSTNISWVDKDTKENGVDVANSISKDITLRQMLIDGLNYVKKYNESLAKARAKLAESVDKADIVDLWNETSFNVDRLIARRMGGKRNGLRVRWEIEDGIYEFDPFINKLYKIDE